MKEEFDELVAYLKRVPLPTKPVKILGYVTVSDPKVFLESCERGFKSDPDYVMQKLRAYKTEVQRSHDEAAAD